jgi:type 1 glutamine amidotransferase/nicotinamidase-related amidase
MRQSRRALFLSAMLFLAPSLLAQPLTLHSRTRVETSPGSGRFHTVIRTEEWDPTKTAIVICDMWDKHWCQGATRRVAEMAPRMNEVLNAARAKGVLIIHSPSDTMKFYATAPQRQLAKAAPSVPGRPPIPGQCTLASKDEPSLPIDFSDDGCDCTPTCKHGSPWRRQIDTLQIQPNDAITDSGEAYNLMRARGIDNVIIMGVHTNICVLGRPFGIRQMVRQGQRVLLMRDLTDTMYNSRSAPYVNHFTGTDLVVEHIEKYWCPTITSADFLAGKPLRFTEDKRPHLVIIMAEDEYDTATTLPPWALRDLGKDFKISCVFSDDASPNDIPGMEILDDADIALISVRRRFPTPEQLAPLRRFVAAGKPIVGIRTASHAFASREPSSIPAGRDSWPQFDHDVIGGHYTNHHSNKGEPKTWVQLRPDQVNHPILKGITSEEFHVPSWLYKTSPLEPQATILMMGRVEGRTPAEPVAWTYLRKDHGRTFYTSLGHRDDLTIPNVRRLLVNGLYWAADLPIPETLPDPNQQTAARPAQHLRLIVDRLRSGLDDIQASSNKRPPAATDAPQKQP